MVWGLTARCARYMERRQDGRWGELPTPEFWKLATERWEKMKKRQDER